MDDSQLGIIGRGNNVNGEKTKARLNNLAWALLLILVGIALLLQHTFNIGLNGVINAVEIGIGVIFVGINITGHFLGLKMNAFWSAVGVLLIADGFNGILRLDISVFALALIAVGTWIVLKSVKKTES